MSKKLSFAIRYFCLSACILTVMGVLWEQKGDAAMRALGITPTFREEPVNAACGGPGESTECDAEALPLSPPPPPPFPQVTLAVPAQGLIGEDFSFTVTFENPQSGTLGFAPAIDLVLDSGGADQNTASGPCDGIKIVSAEMIGVNGGPISITPLTSAAPCGTPASIMHPFGGSPFGPVAVPAGAEMSTLVPPFGSFQSTQPTITIKVTAHIHNYADLGYPLAIYARGIYRFGDDPLNNPVPNPPIFSDATLTAAAWAETGTITPALLVVGKSYKGAEQETATGPNFPHKYEISANVAAGQTVTSVAVVDCLSSNMQYVSLDTAATTPGYTVVTTPSTTQPCLRLDYPSVTGTTGTEIKVVFNFFIPLNDPNGSILDPATCTNAGSTDTASVTLKWTPLDPRDGPGHTVSSNPVVDTVAAKRITIKKTVQALPVPPGPLRPGKILRYAVDMDISDYFTVGRISINDMLGDGQAMLTTGTYAPKLTITDRRGPATNVPISIGNGITTSPNPFSFCNGVKGGTTILFQVSQAMVNNSALFTSPVRKQGILTGGHAFSPFSSTAATVRIVYHASVLDTFIHPQPGEGHVDKHDPLNNCVSGGGTIHTNDPTMPQPVLSPPLNIPLGCGDDSLTSVMLPGDVLEKKIVARNGSTTDPQLSQVPPRFAAADTITFRISKTLPAGDFEKLTIEDWAPLPVLPLTGLVLDTLPCPAGILPAAGHICRGSGHNLNVTPTLTLNPVDNSLKLDYGTHNETSNTPKTIQLYISLKVSADPYADGLFLNNEAQECEYNTFGTRVCQVAVARFELTEPNVRIRKGVIAINKPNPIFLPGPPFPAAITAVSQLTSGAGSCGLPGTCARIWTNTGTITSTMLNANPNFFNSDIVADANDWVTFVILLENRGNGINGAFDVRIRDTPHTGFVSPSSSFNLRGHDGTGAQINLAPPGVFQLMTPAGKELLDPGPTPGGALDRFSLTSGRNLAIVTYNMRVAGTNTVQIGTCYPNTAELINYAAVEGGPNFVTAGFTPPFADNARVCLTPVLEKSLVATSEPHTTPQTSGGSGVPKLAIGEIARYQLRVRLPEGTGPNFQVQDALPAGMKFMNDGSARIAFISNGPGISHPSFPGTGFNVSGNQSSFPLSPTQPIATGITVGGNCGDDPTFNLGNIQNNDDDPDQEFIVIEFNALVCNVPGNQAGTTLSDTFSVTVAGNPAATSNQVNAVVVEPKLNVTKTAAPTSVNPGGIVTFTVKVTNGGTSDAFDAQITDPMPAASGLLPMGPITLASSCVAAVPVLNTTTGVISVPRLPVGCTITVTLQARAGVACPTPSVTNTAFATYTSLPANGTPIGASNPTGSVTPGAGNAVDGERFYSDSGSVTVPVICSTSSSCASPPPNMVAWWPFDEQNGATTAVDIWGGHTATQLIGGSPSPLVNAQPGKVVGSLWITNNYASVPDTPALKFGTGNMSIDSWVKSDQPLLIASVVDKLDIGAKKGYALYIENKFLKFVMGNGTALTTYVSTGQVNIIFGTMTWHHVAVTVDRSGGMGRFYIDGAPAGTFVPLGSTVDISSTSSLLLGGSRLTFPPPMSPCVCEFNIDEIEVFNEVVSAANIQAIFAAGAAGKCH